MSLIYDFADIRSRMLGDDKPKPKVTRADSLQPYRDTMAAMVAVLNDPVCESCDGGGWECYGLGIGDPHFRECPKCGNPEGHPSP